MAGLVGIPYIIWTPSEGDGMTLTLTYRARPWYWVALGLAVIAAGAA